MITRRFKLDIPLIFVMCFLALSCAHTPPPNKTSTQASSQNVKLSDELEELDDLDFAGAGSMSESEVVPRKTIKTIPQAEFSSPQSRAPAQRVNSPKSYNRAPASTGAKGFFATTYQNCQAFAEASEASQKVKAIGAGKKIWVERSAQGWVKIFLKNSFAFLPTNCLNN